MIQGKDCIDVTKGVLVFSLLLFVVATPVMGQSQLSLKEKLADLVFLEGALLHAHPSAGRYTPRSEISGRIRSLREDIRTGREKYPFRLAIGHIISRIHCIHTSLLGSRRFTKKYIRKNGLPSVLPLRTYYDGRQLWVSDVFADTLNSLRGMRVDSIDHRPASRVMEVLMQYRSGDGYSDSFMQAMINRSVQFSVLYKRYFEPDTAIHLAGVKNGARVSATVPFRKMKIPILRKTAGDPVFQTPNHTFSIDSLTGAGVLRIRSFNPQKKLKRFYRNVFRFLHENETGHLVIDLRGNSGGNINEAKRLLSYTLDTTVFFTLERSKSPLCKYTTFMSNYYAFMNFLKRKIFSFARKYRIGKLFIVEQKRKARRKFNFDGRIYILQDGYTASSSSFVSTYLKEHRDATVIGTESGGGAAGNNGLFYATSKLPNSRIKVRLPQYWLNYHLIPDEGRGVLPDREVNYTIRDILNRRDLEMEIARSIIKKQKS